MSVEDPDEAERLALEDQLNDFIITLGLGTAYEVDIDDEVGETAYLYAVQGAESRTFYPIYLLEFSTGRVTWQELGEGGLKWCLKQGADRVRLPDHIARWYTLVGIDYREGNQP